MMQEATPDYNFFDNNNDIDLGIGSGELTKRGDTQRHVLRLSREGNVSEVKDILKSRDEKFSYVDWTDAMFEAAYSVVTPPQQKKEMLWTLSSQLSGRYEERLFFCHQFYSLGTSLQHEEPIKKGNSSFPLNPSVESSFSQKRIFSSC